MSERIPFEPGKKSKKKQAAKQVSSQSALQSQAPTKGSRDDFKIPEVVNKRIVRRVGLFSGIPTFTGFAVFIASYVIVANHFVELPNSVVVLLSMACLGLGVVGISYGALSASWDENKLGHWFGWQEFKTNLGYLVNAWKEQRAMQKSGKSPSDQASN